jgi:hypothetical protein
MSSPKIGRLTSKFGVHAHHSGYPCDISTTNARPEAKVSYTFRPLAEADDARAFDTTGFSNVEARELEGRRRLYESGLRTCYCAALDDGPAAGTIVFLC